MTKVKRFCSQLMSIGLVLISCLKMGFADLAPFLLHSVAIAHYMAIEHYCLNYLDLPEHGAYQIFHVLGGRYKFLTVWNMIFQATFFAICLLNDAFGSNEVHNDENSSLRKVRDFLHAAVGFPLCLFVAISFWTLWTVDRNLVFPPELDEFFPNWLNHSMHTTVVIYTLLHTFVCYNKYPSRFVGIATLLGVVLAYISWILSVYFETGMWIYPIFDVLNWPMRLIFLTLSISFLVTQYFVGEFLNNAIWGKI